jgi:hypothetical protein
VWSYKSLSQSSEDTKEKRIDWDEAPNKPKDFTPEPRGLSSLWPFSERINEDSE